MALKDWKKVGYTNISGEAGWINKHFNLNLEIIKTLRGTYKVYVEKIIGVYKTVMVKEFNNNIQALKYAKSYMRKH